MMNEFNVMASRAFNVAGKINAGEPIEYKKVKMVRTASGMRRYGQDKGSIIIKDGEKPLDALTALNNDIQGYEKLGDKNGNTYYIGMEEGRFVVRNPADNSLMFETPNESDAYNWLNKKVGGGDSSVGDNPSPFDASPNKKPGDSQEREKIREDLSAETQDQGRLGKGPDLDVAQAVAVDSLTDDEMAKYQRYRQRGLDHREAYRLSQGAGLSGSPQAVAARRAARKKGRGTK